MESATHSVQTPLSLLPSESPFHLSPRQPGGVKDQTSVGRSIDVVSTLKHLVRGCVWLPHYSSLCVLYSAYMRRTWAVASLQHRLGCGAGRLHHRLNLDSLGWATILVKVPSYDRHD